MKKAKEKIIAYIHRNGNKVQIMITHNFSHSTHFITWGEWIAVKMYLIAQ